ncbi:tRNA lysidine(34) synthetase TilS [Pseudomaricurvus sp. HS19]|uniref:tRNA lysidine(34) synthetase TilS n=1 Tax=Pseudomaricurvus sp. HS19 TaxID=2692626 RepID=UPI00136D358C|nr:tRNA lysidine(34) synthetase TilS [Pseudomaricurvus sp. HS19]MYM65066.1 tRNA lysidine(34) synthetase TilS [Pseudomaricurvus sp. HS19]
MLDLMEQLRRTLASYPDVRRWWIGLSGGLDSTLLAACVRDLQLAVPVHCVYIHHGLSAHADEWQRHCEALCRQWQIPFTALAVDVQVGGQGVEAAAREARYQAFETLLQPGDGLLLGHHLDDQAETLLLRLMRGTGVTGLAGIQKERALGQGFLLRPLLGCSRQQLEQEAQRRNLQWVEDDSNSQTHFDRNYLRLQVMPLLQERWPGFRRQWQQTADLCEETAALVEEVAVADLAACQPERSREGASLEMAALQGLTPFRRGNVLRLWLQQQGRALPEKVHLQEVESQLVPGRSDSEAEVSWRDVRLQVHRQRLWLLPDLQSPVPGDPLGWDGSTPLRWGSWELQLETVTSGGWRWPSQGVLVQARRGGERCHPAGRSHSQVLKKLLQEAGVAPWLRPQLPIITTLEGEIVAVGDLWCCRGWESGSGPGVRLRWEYRPA